MKDRSLHCAGGIFCFIALFASVHLLGQDLTWHAEKGYRWATLPSVTASAPGFTRLAPENTHILFTNRLSELSIASNRVLANGSGVAVGDFDQDGWPDIFFCGLESPNALYRNLGNWQFQDVTAEAGLGSEQSSRGAVFADIDGDGFPDLLVSTVNRGVRCYINQHNGKFIETTQNAGTASKFGSMTMALADIDGNGTLDLYVANYRPDDMRDRGRFTLPAVKGKPVIPASEKDHFILRNGQLFEYGQPDQLFLNDGKGQFHPALWNDGTFLDELGQKLDDAPLDWGLSASFRDVNGDGAPDLYVCNDYWTPDRFWINDGHGHFKAIAPLALRKSSSSSMGVDFADIDRDGFLDFFAVDMLSGNPQLRKRQSLADRPAQSIVGAIEDRPQVIRNTLFHGRSDGTYAEIANFAGLAGSDWSWSPQFLDVDLDGFEDLVISAGHFRDVQDLDAQAQIQARQHPWTGFKSEAERQAAYTRELMEHYRLYPPLDMPIKSFHNLRGVRFEESTTTWGLAELAIHHGMAVGDFDRDGDLDLVVNNLNSAAGVYRNNVSRGRLAVRLKGVSPNTEGVGAKVTLVHGAVELQSTELVSGGRYLSGSEPLVVFATEGGSGPLVLKVSWRSGKVQQIDGVQPARLYEIDESSAVASSLPAKSQPNPLFEDRSSALNHRHAESGFDDFQRQPLLPFKLSQNGPGIAWFDLDGDGHDDLIIGAGAGFPPSVYKSDGRGSFTSLPVSADLAGTSDYSGFVGMNDRTGKSFLLAGLTGYENKGSNNLIRFGFRDATVASEKLGLQIATASALALGLDEKGAGLVLFVGGGVNPGRYPVGSPSRILRYNGNEWSVDVENSAFISSLGIVNSAVWTDFNGDGVPELVVTSEWGPVRIFQWRGRRLFDITSETGLSEYTGLWKGITAGDFDGDGRMDLVVANWGLNSSYVASARKPLTLYHGEMAQPGVMDVIETEWDSARNELTPTRQITDLAASLPFLLERFSSHLTYSQASLSNVLGDRLPLARKLEINTLESSIFLNRGDHFEIQKLPAEAQMAPAFGVNVADFDGDGREDLFLSQNFFATRPGVPRLDAGRGLLLRGDGTGRFTPVAGEDSGLLIYGEQRGAAICDFNEDGRPDLVVTQNGAATKLYQNNSGRVGIRIRLSGPRENPHGIGASIRISSKGHSGPAREIHAGSGWWSHDSAIEVMAPLDAP
ncbi:MAG: ASPIC/UnbV domain protein, partial [Verrucomicrobiales bacterium]|nr:ASPIC/UnbV domain protein [Verrucomicrobiales bacterium]